MNSFLFLFIYFKIYLNWEYSKGFSAYKTYVWPFSRMNVKHYLKPHLLIIVLSQKIRYFSLFLGRLKEDGSKTFIFSLNILGSSNCMITSKYLFELSPAYTFLFHSTQNDPKIEKDPVQNNKRIRFFHVLFWYSV